MVYPEIVLETKYIFIAFGMWECSCRKNFDVLKINLVHYFELRRHMNNAFSSYFIVIYDKLLHFWEIN